MGGRALTSTAAPRGVHPQSNGSVQLAPPAVVESPATAAADPARLSYLVTKRVVDIALSVILMVLLLPLFLSIALVIKATSRGRVFYTQTRVGRGGDPFTLIKFRTMRPGTNEALRADPELYERYVANGYKLPRDDDRTTAVGRFLRKTSLDELPQLLNVFAGQMSVVGVRPLVAPEFAERPARDRELYAAMRPGLTGLWQVAGRSRLAHASRLELDRQYGQQCSPMLDVKIVFRTPLAVLRTRDTQ